MIRQIWFQNRQNIEKIVPMLENELKNHKMLYLAWKVRFLYCFTVSNILTDNLIKTYLKLRNIHFKQIAKSIPTLGKKPCRDILLKPDFVLYPIDISSCEIIFLLISHVFIVL
jgi:hypothetical protein